MSAPAKKQILSHRDLLVWQRGLQLVDRTYRLTDRFPKTERLGLTAQMRRSAVSVPANIAEGHGRRTTRDFLHFLAIANGSLRELETHFDVSELRKYLGAAELEQVRAVMDEIGRMLAGLCAALRRTVVP
jgi:four helix bundle protein